MGGAANDDVCSWVGRLRADVAWRHAHRLDCQIVFNQIVRCIVDNPQYDDVQPI